MAGPGKDLEELVARWDARLRRAFLDLVDELRGSVDVEELARLIAEGNAQDALRELDRAAAAFSDGPSEAFVQSARVVSEWAAASLSVRVSFDQVNVRAVEAMRSNRLRLVTNLTEGQRAAVREVLLNGVVSGQNPVRTAREIRASIGLTEGQVRQVESYRSALRDLRRDALDRALRDRRSDSVVRRAIETGRELSEERIDRMVERYRERVLDYRARTIARTESMRAVNEGAEESLRQMVDAGIAGDEDVTLVWRTAKDERVRGSHRSMNGQRRTMAQIDAGNLFVSGRGNRLARPGDSNAAASEVVNCRCVLSVEVDAAPSEDDDE